MEWVTNIRCCTNEGARGDLIRAWSAAVLEVLRQVWGTDLPPGLQPETVLTDAVAIDDELGLEAGYLVHGDYLTYRALGLLLQDARTPGWARTCCRWSSSPVSSAQASSSRTSSSPTPTISRPHQRAPAMRVATTPTTTLPTTRVVPSVLRLVSAMNRGTRSGPGT